MLSNVIENVNSRNSSAPCALTKWIGTNGKKGRKAMSFIICLFYWKCNVVSFFCGRNESEWLSCMTAMSVVLMVMCGSFHLNWLLGIIWTFEHRNVGTKDIIDCQWQFVWFLFFYLSSLRYCTPIYLSICKAVTQFLCFRLNFIY